MTAAPAFDLFVILAGMRTGSNLLQEALNALPGLRCHGEVFNPEFVESPERTRFLGMTRAERDADPLALLGRLRGGAGVLSGFRLFAHHDARVLDACLADRRCAKVVLTRHPVDSFASLSIAQRTDQWQLGHPQDRRAARIDLDPPEFAEFLLERGGFHRRILRRLQASGQTGFVLDYEDLEQPEVIEGLALFLTGARPIGPPRPAQRRLVRQNPGRALDKFADPVAAAALLSDVDWFDLARTPLSEPLCTLPGAAPPPRPVLALGAPLVCLPIPGTAGLGAVCDWMAGLRAAPAQRPSTTLAAPVAGGVTVRADLCGPAGALGIAAAPSPGLLEAWLAATAGGRCCIALIEHPLPRAWRAYRALLAATASGAAGRFGATPTGVGSPVAPVLAIGDPQAGFAAFLRLVADCQAGQYPGFSIRPEWLGQGAWLEAHARLLRPDRLIRVEAPPAALPTALTALAREMGWNAVAQPGVPTARLAPANAPCADAPLPGWCADRQITDLAQRAYGGDYRALGFAPMP